MNYIEFMGILFENFFRLIGIGLLVLFFYFPVLKKKKFDIFSPNFNIFYNSITCLTLFIFLLSLKKIEQFYISYYLSCEIFFIIGFCLNIGKEKYKLNYEANLEFRGCDFLFYLFTCLMYFVPTFIIYIVKGIPLFLDSRFEASLNGGGFGIFTRFADFSGIFVCYFSCFILLVSKNVKHRFYAKIIISLYCVTLFLSGSRSSFLGLFKAIFIISVSLKNIKPELLEKFNKKKWKYLPVLIILALLLFFLKSKKNFLIDFVFRVVSQGDSIFLAYPNNQIEKLTHYSLFELLFSNLLSTFRLYNSDKVIMPYGMELINVVYGHFNNGGAVSINNIDGYVNFREFAFIFSFCIGLFLNFTMNQIYKIYDSKLLFVISYSICTLTACLSYNFLVGIGYFTTCIMNIPVYIIVYYLLKYIKVPQNYKNIAITD